METFPVLMYLSYSFLPKKASIIFYFLTISSKPQNFKLIFCVFLLLIHRPYSVIIIFFLHSLSFFYNIELMSARS